MSPIRKIKRKEHVVFMAIIPLLFCLIVSCRPTANIDATSVAFHSVEYDFGKLQLHQAQTCRFEITNTGTQPLVISNVEVTCGCTVASWKKKPVRPGKTTSLELTYDSEYPGWFQKTIRVHSNAIGAPHTLIIKGEVIQNQ
jgi:hypothetical protein